MTKDECKIKLYGLTLDCSDPVALATFYGELLKWDIVYSDESFACLGPPSSHQGGYPCIMFQRNPEYTPPTRPEAPGAQQQMAHMDFAVNDVESAVQRAIRCGATVAAQQFSDQWKVMLDPAGHPFCLCDMKPLIESADFALL